MNENEVEAVETEEEYFELPYDPDADPEWDAVTWGDSDDEEEETSKDETETADQPDPEQSETPAEPEAQNTEEAEDADQWLELKHMDDEPRKVSKEEAKALAQKGLDYDRIREERDNLKSSLPKYQEMEKFLKEMQGDFESIEEFMDDTRARVKADAEGISYNDALEQVRAAKAPAPEQHTDDSGINVDGFLKQFPDVKAEDIPASVWADVNVTGDLRASYEKYDTNKKNDRLAELEREIETLKNNQKNANRSTGSSKSSGTSSGKSLIASMWENDD